MTHIFISYSKKNSAYAYKLADFLQGQGFNIWIDRIGIEYGVGWWDAIVDGIDACGAFIVLMSPESRQSDWVQREVFIALQDKKPMFPLLLDADNWKVFVLTQYADVRDGSLPENDFLKRLAEHVTPRGKGTNKSDLTPEKQQSNPIPPPVPRFDVDKAIADFGKAFREKKWSEALNILGRIRASGEDTTPFDVNNFEQQIHTQIENEKRAREQEVYAIERDRQYRRILMILDYADSEVVWSALQTFWQTFPDYDPDNIADKPGWKPKRSPYSGILPAPFEWISIPGGQITLKTERYWTGNYIPKGEVHTFILPTFEIAKYPITNAQFAKFLDANGYGERQWWTDAGWERKNREKWSEPRYWSNKKWNGNEQPVVGVSWYEAIAFCQWLSEETGDNILLPTEQQWERAAQGDDNLTYPWGDIWNCQLCNNSVEPCHSKVTTRVHDYEGKGDSPFGVVDMAGNVKEWSVTEYKSGNSNIIGTGVRVLCGGSWLDVSRFSFRSGGRRYNNSYLRKSTYGFRISHS